MRAVCRHLDVPTFDVEFIREYWSDVFVPFLEAYKTGKETPNPDVLCNKTVKFCHFRNHVLDTLQADQAAKQVELDQTFFLNFGKKGELKDAISALKKEAKEVSKQLEGAAKVEGKAQDAFDKQSEAAAKQADVAAKVVADAVKQSEKIEADAAKKADKIVSDTQKAAAAAVKEADKAAATLRRAAAVAAKAEAKLVR
jgi:alpha-glucosidase (family GH31 glycosyl hydrolase)